MAYPLAHMPRPPRTQSSECTASRTWNNAHSAISIGSVRGVPESHAPQPSSLLWLRRCASPSHGVHTSCPRSQRAHEPCSPYRVEEWDKLLRDANLPENYPDMVESLCKGFAVSFLPIHRTQPRPGLLCPNVGLNSIPLLLLNNQRSLASRYPFLSCKCGGFHLPRGSRVAMLLKHTWYDSNTTSVAVAGSNCSNGQGCPLH
ncbi:hypothetical protein BDZ97DRAFT_1789374 [Flammula alnicola]|nr:hypothetical protein BDZ97DRAFT_1789374 [Flammula alnicola]